MRCYYDELRTNAKDFEWILKDTFSKVRSHLKQTIRRSKQQGKRSASTDSSEHIRKKHASSQEATSSQDAAEEEVDAEDAAGEGAGNGAPDPIIPIKPELQAAGSASSDDLWNFEAATQGSSSSKK
jgi:hypothetical protein